MITTLRTKLLLGLAPLLALMVGLGLWAVFMFSKLGNDIDVILRENYRSVRAAQNMKEALERMDSAALFAIGGRLDRAKRQFAESRPVFESNLKVELGNVTLPGEADAAERLRLMFNDYLRLSEVLYRRTGPDSAQAEIYFGELFPKFAAIKAQADAIQELNQRNMEQENEHARRSSSLSTRLMIGALAGAAALATAIAFVLSRSILEPIGSVTRAARAIAAGNYDQVVSTSSRDELGELAAAFNTMARQIREYRNAGTARLVRAQAAAQATIDSFPDPVVVVDTAGAVERVNPAARRVLGVWPADGVPTPWAAPPSIRSALTGVLGGLPDVLPTGVENALCLRDEGQERFYLPRVLAIRDDSGSIGAAVVLQDVTKFRLVDQLKSDMVSTVSHELKTPLTSVQMAVHLLLEEAVGTLNPKQTELLLAARQESERLQAMVNDLLDLARIEQGRLRLDLAAAPAGELISTSLGRLDGRPGVMGVTVESDVEPDLPELSVDRERIGRVFDNLLGNALRHAGRGGRVRIEARAEDGGRAVRFSVRDDGEGVTAEHLPHLFERFYRVPGSRNRGGAGLGLAIVRDIVTEHGGRVGVESTPGHGATFHVTLPAV